MRITENANLKEYNSFGTSCIAQRLFHLKKETDVHEYQKHPDGYPKHKLLISGGSNILLGSQIKGSVAKIEWDGISVLKEYENHVLIQVSAGHSWHDFVIWAIDHEFGGIENLSLIPGHVGTAPIQNIGAYGVEAKDSIESVRYFNWNTGETEKISNKDCKFGYRTSIFKTIRRKNGVILSVNFQLTKNNHNYNTEYGAISEELKKYGLKKSLSNISKVVITIRNRKLPNPKLLGNAGSFFKNPVVGIDQLKILQKEYPKIPFYKQSNNQIKLSGAWLIEKSGWKGKSHKDAGMHNKQALVLVNHGNSTGEELWEFAKRVKRNVQKKFQIKLEPEVNLIEIEA